MNAKQAMEAAAKVIAKAKSDLAGWWCVSCDRRGHPVRMFVPEGAERIPIPDVVEDIDFCAFVEAVAAYDTGAKKEDHEA